MSIWSACDGVKHIDRLTTHVWRLVETQHRSSTRKLVDTRFEHDVLEEILEASKPITPAVETPLHYLLSTPFRYPPLEYGSRFGKTNEPSLFYGSLDLTTAFAEVAYYRFVFLHHTTAQLNMIETLLTAFNVLVDTEYGIDLTTSVFANYQEQLVSPKQYTDSQALGADMRDANVAAFIYYSARVKSGKNLGAFTPNVFPTREPEANSWQTWRCFTNINTVEFSRGNLSSAEQYYYEIEQFCVGDELPIPA